ncbi:ABC transporter ATP-binding protein [Streptococcus suis]|uniref:ABC transporter ATP-binding protein n=1 Tax=Streptococcus suis TaxID=1307 RepID=UPI000CF5B26D|nr:ABC transporter ATP-binding protein [Streptococcus suis]MBM0195559.1 ABC transporter ATP-binding protein [Streptococcus suis]MBM7316985.1 ABC transporter ATP-binding protein [Streptococcus suis]HEM4695618.1 ABC transporter ATP-binding protein [Streptococcus suis]HEM4859429.1 ABC transporter ATP-binding protein [Streptococcus suis]HEM4897414.1 ABC transporter ATP-binding protein [Streptococcus suis]
MDKILSACHLSKSFGSQEVLTNINFDIQSGDIVGLIGKNGCGKTTLMKMILGLTSRTEGDIQFEGDSNYHTKRTVLNKIGFLLDCKLFEDFSAYDNLKLFSMYSSTFDRKKLDERITTLLTFVGLDNGKKPVKTYSFGMKQRLGLALALLDDPEFLILDEPFVGLDPAGVRIFLDYIVKLRQEKGVTILISSHQLHEIGEICDYFLFINEKRVEMHSKLGENKIIITLDHVVPELEECLKVLVDIKENQIVLPQDVSTLNSILKLIYKYNGEIKDITIKESIEELFRGVKL